MTSPNGCTIAIQAILLKSKKKILYSIYSTPSPLPFSHISCFLFITKPQNLTNPGLKVANPALIHPYLKTTVCVSFVLGLQQFYIKNVYCKYCNDWTSDSLIPMNDIKFIGETCSNVSLDSLSMLQCIRIYHKDISLLHVYSQYVV